MAAVCLGPAPSAAGVAGFRSRSECSSSLPVPRRWTSATAAASAGPVFGRHGPRQSAVCRDRHAQPLDPRGGKALAPAALAQSQRFSALTRDSGSRRSR